MRLIVTATLKSFYLFESCLTLPIGIWSISPKQSLCSDCGQLTRSSQSLSSILRGKETNFFGGQFASDSSARMSGRNLFLFPICRTMSEASFQRCRYRQGQSKKRATRRCQHSTTAPLTTRPLMDEDSCMIAPAHSQIPDVSWLLTVLLV